MSTWQAFEKEAQTLDAEDTLASFREIVVINDPDLIYLDGNSLGRLPKVTAERLADAVTKQWGARLIRSWNEGWFTLAHEVGAKIAGIIGAAPDEVIIADSTSVNLYKLIHSRATGTPQTYHPHQR